MKTKLGSTQRAQISAKAKQTPLTCEQTCTFYSQHNVCVIMLQQGHFMLMLIAELWLCWLTQRTGLKLPRPVEILLIKFLDPHHHH